jgi:hypothetical protein
MDHDADDDDAALGARGGEGSRKARAAVAPCVQKRRVGMRAQVCAWMWVGCVSGRGGSVKLHMLTAAWEHLAIADWIQRLIGYSANTYIYMYTHT